MQYLPVEVKHNDKTYKGTVTRKQPPFVPGKQQNGYHYMFVFEQWRGDVSGILVISQENGKWVPHNSGTIMDLELAQAAGESLT